MQAFVDPSPEFSGSLESWEDAKKLIEEKQYKVSDTGGLANFLISESEGGTLSLELKCFVAAVSLQTCRIASRRVDRAMAQSMFKSKVKADKSKHIGNLVSNTWLQESLQQLEKSNTTNDATAKMHVNLLTTGLHFMEDCFVIDNEKKVNVLKEKQGIDWRRIAAKISSFASLHNVDALAELATTIVKYLTDFNPANKSSDAAVAVTPSAPSPKAVQAVSVDSQVLQDAAKMKREERMKNLRKKASYTSTTVNPPSTTSATEDAWAASAAGVSRGSFSAPATFTRSPKVKQSWNTAPPPTSQGSYPQTAIASSAKTESWSASSTSYSGGGSNVPVTTGGASNADHAYADAPAPADNSRWNNSTPASNGPSSAGGASSSAARGFGDSLAYNSKWGGDSTRNAASGYDATPSWGTDPSNVPAHESTDQSSWNNTNANYWQGASDYPSHGGSASGQDSYHKSNSSGRGYDDSATATYNSAPPRTSTPAVNAGSADASSRDRYYPGTSTADTSGSVHDNQYRGGGAGAGGWDQPAGNYAPSPQRGGGAPPFNGNSNKRSNDYDNRDNHQQGDGRGGGERQGNKRPRQEFAPAFEDSSLQSGGGGRGRGRTLPSWITKDRNGNEPQTVSLEPPPPQIPQHTNGGASLPPRDLPPPASLQGTGRGRGRTLPAWMTQPNDGPAGQAVEPPRGPPPPSFGVGPPRGPPPASFGGDNRNDVSGGGRGRGRTLPAWMTAQQSNDGLGS